MADNKTAFILAQPPKTSAKRVVELAKKAGLNISDKYVHVVRSNARRGKTGRRSRPAGSARESEKEFRRLVVELGLERAGSLLKDTADRVRRAVAQ